MNLNTIGGKGFNLIVLAQGGFHVPNAFIIREEAFVEFRSGWNCPPELQQGETLTEEKANAIQKQFDEYELREELVAEIQNQLHDLQNNSSICNPLLAVRSSGVTEDLENASFAGMNDTVLNVHCDVASVCTAVKQCWKSLYSYRSIQYRVQNGFPAFDTSIAVVVQIMIPADCAGVAFTADPQTNSRAHISLDGVQGLGEALVSGQVNADHWRIRKPYGRRDYAIEEECLPVQSFKLVSNYPKAGTSKVELTAEEGSRACFTAEQVAVVCGVKGRSKRSVARWWRSRSTTRRRWMWSSPSTARSCSCCRRGPSRTCWPCRTVRDVRCAEV